MALFLGFLADFALDLFPFHAKGRIGQAVIEGFPRQAIGGKGVAEDDVPDVLAFDEHVRLADGVGLGIEFLPIHDEARIGIQAGEMFARHAQHAAGAGSRIVDGTHHARLGQGFVVLDEEEIDHEPDDFARGEVFAGGLVGEFGELADEFLEHRAHLGIADDVGMEINIGELLGNEIEQSCFGEAINLGVELEALKDVAHGGRKCLHVSAKVFGDMILIAHELLQVEGRGVVKELVGFFEQERFGVHLGSGALGEFGQHSGLGGFEHAIQPTQHRERENDLGVIGLLVVAAQEIGNGPDEAGEVGVRHVKGGS